MDEPGDPQWAFELVAKALGGKDVERIHRKTCGEGLLHSAPCIRLRSAAASHRHRLPKELVAQK